jgi:hypothetical protein
MHNNPDSGSTRKNRQGWRAVAGPLVEDATIKIPSNDRIETRRRSQRTLQRKSGWLAIRVNEIRGMKPGTAPSTE